MKIESITSIKGVIGKRNEMMFFGLLFFSLSIVFTIFSFFNLAFIAFTAIMVGMMVISSTKMIYWDLRYWDLMKCKEVNK